jgi:hypothetical protein
MKAPTSETAAAAPKQSAAAKQAAAKQAAAAKEAQAAKDVAVTTEPSASRALAIVPAAAPKTAPMFDAAPLNVKQGMEKAMKTAEEFVAFNKGNMEAFVKSGQIWATGMQDLSKHIAAAAQASMEESMTTFKALSTVKSLKDAFELQSSFARAALEKTMAESGKITDASFKLTEQALAPITARVTVAVETFSKAA